MRYITTMVIKTDYDPTSWDLNNFHAALENGEAVEVMRIMVPLVSGEDLDTVNDPPPP